MEEAQVLETSEDLPLMVLANEDEVNGESSVLPLSPALDDLTQVNLAIQYKNDEESNDLFKAIQEGCTEDFSTLLNRGASLENLSEDKCNALHVAAKYDQSDIMQLIKQHAGDTFASYAKAFNDNGFTPIHLAAKYNSPKCLRILGHEPDVWTSNLLKTRLPDNASSTTLHLAALGDFVEVAEAILDFDNSAYEHVNAYGLTPLHVAADNCSRQVLELLVKRGAVLSTLTEGDNKRTAIEIIADKLPNPTRFFEEIFDHQISYSGDNKIVVKFDILTNSKNMNQIKAVEKLIECGQSQILLHPFMQTLMYLKWKTLEPVFYVTLAISISYVVVLNSFFGTFFYYHDTGTNMPSFLTNCYWPFMVFNYVLVIILMTQVLYTNRNTLHYYRHFETWITIGCVMLAAGAPVALALAGPASWLRAMISIGIPLTWLRLIYIVSRFPDWGYYILKYGEVARSIFKILATFGFLILGFSLAFMIQFGAQPPFDGPWRALLKTVVMMTSEFDYGSLFETPPPLAAEWISRILFSLFLVFMAVILMNFMTGVAVSDVNEINLLGKRWRLEKQTLLLGVFESEIRSNRFVKGLLVMYNKRKYHLQISIKPSLEKKWTVSCESLDEPNLTYKLQLPMSLQEMIIEKANKQSEKRRNSGSNLEKDLMNLVAKSEKVFSCLENIISEMKILSEEIKSLKQ